MPGHGSRAEQVLIVGTVAAFRPPSTMLRRAQPMLVALLVSDPESSMPRHRCLDDRVPNAKQRNTSGVALRSPRRLARTCCCAREVSFFRSLHHSAEQASRNCELHLCRARGNSCLVRQAWCPAEDSPTACTDLETSWLRLPAVDSRCVAQPSPLALARSTAKRAVRGASPAAGGRKLRRRAGRWRFAAPCRLRSRCSASTARRC